MTTAASRPNRQKLSSEYGLLGFSSVIFVSSRDSDLTRVVINEPSVIESDRYGCFFG